MSIRLRFTLYSAVVLTVALAFFSVVVYTVLSLSLTRQVDVLLSQTAEQVLRSTRVTSVQEVAVLSIPRLETFQTSETYVQVFDGSGRLQGESENLNGVDQPLDPLGLAEIGNQNAFVHETMLLEQRIRVLTVPIRVDGQGLGYLQVATSMALVEQARTQLLVILIVGSMAAVAVATLVSSLMTYRALRPLRVVTNTAQSITEAQDLSQRIPYLGPVDDELGNMVGAFNKALTRIEHLFYAQRRFVADVSHELRTPLTTIRANIDLMRMFKTYDKESIDAITSESGRMLRMVDDLLMLAQAETGNLTMAHEKVSLDGLLLEVYRTAQVLAGDRVTVVLTEEDQAEVMGDADRLKQVLLNLVTNALKYTPPGGKISLGVTKKKGFARFSVSDTGPGIPLEDQPHIFNHFYRVEKSRVRAKVSDVTGAGLGLAIAKWIVEAHDGRIQVVSAEGQGATFFVWLPLTTDGKNGTGKLLQEPTGALIESLKRPTD